MGNDKMREEFEAWVLDKWPETDLGQFNDGEYCGFTLQHCWAAWQASRAAVVVELPTGQCLFDRSSGRAAGGLPLVELKTVADAIEVAGLKYEVKP